MKRHLAHVNFLQKRKKSFLRVFCKKDSLFFSGVQSSGRSDRNAAHSHMTNSGFRSRDFTAGQSFSNETRSLRLYCFCAFDLAMVEFKQGMPENYIQADIGNEKPVI